ncbi:hypothetical protein VNI00_003167 [Paramarasmius palmivorus]|uniref:Uncharacterized protein n=1 Tax=Paramarasmius palmivorus TaxID=297713 RepID=A0AAW0DT57_9AGAR
MAEAPFYGLLLRSNCPITVLDLTVRLTDKALAESLQSMPLLEVLRFTDAYPIRVVEGSATLQLSSNIFSRALVQSLTPRASESRLLPELLCPRLETVEFYSCPITLADDLIVFAGARRCGPIQVTKALKTFKVVFRPNRIGGIGLPSDVLEKVRLLKQSSGLNVDWSSMGAMRLRPTPALYMPEHIVDY